MSKGVCAVSVSPAVDRTIFINDFALDKVNRVQSSFDTAGSKGINIALNLANCSVPTTCAGFLGGEDAGFIENALEKGGVLSDFVPVSYNVRTNLKVVDLLNKTYTDINFPSGEPTAENISSLKEKIKKLDGENEFIALSGNISSKKLSGLYSELIKNIKTAKVVVDCCGETLRLASANKPYAIKPNLSEFNETFGLNCKTKADIKAEAFKLYETGIKNILVSMDKDGAVCICSGRAYYVHNCDVKVLNTVGAGDAFLSGFIYAKYNNMDDTLSLKHAASFAHAKISRKADASLSLADFVAFVPDIKVEEI